MNYSKEHEVKLTITELEYLLELVRTHEEEGAYWGNKRQFINRQTKVYDKLAFVIANVRRPPIEHE